MRKISRHQARLTFAAGIIALAALLSAGSSSAQTFNPNTYYSTNTITHGMYLPPATLPNGNDEVRASDGTTCRSAMAGNGSYLDIGAIGNQNPERDVASASVYGRMIVPLGQRPSRIDCNALYRLEIERLKSEIEMVRMGANTARSFEPKTPASQTSNWDSEGWHDHRPADRNWKPGTTTTPVR